MDNNDAMTREHLIERVRGLSNEEFSRVAPFLEADLESIEELALIHGEIEAGRQNARTEPILESEEVYARVRQALSG